MVLTTFLSHSSANASKPGGRMGFLWPSARRSQAGPCHPRAQVVKRECCTADSAFNICARATLPSCLPHLRASSPRRSHSMSVVRRFTRRFSVLITEVRPQRSTTGVVLLIICSSTDTHVISTLLFGNISSHSRDGRTRLVPCLSVPWPSARRCWARITRTWPPRSTTGLGCCSSR